MKTYYVEAPLVGKAIGEVRAESEEEAIQKFIQTPFIIEPTLPDSEEHLWFEIMELEIHEQVNRGNVCYAPIGEASAEETDE